MSFLYRLRPEVYLGSQQVWTTLATSAENVWTVENDGLDCMTMWCNSLGISSGIHHQQLEELTTLVLAAWETGDAFQNELDVSRYVPERLLLPLRPSLLPEPSFDMNTWARSVRHDFAVFCSEAVAVERYRSLMAQLSVATSLRASVATRKRARQDDYQPDDLQWSLSGSSTSSPAATTSLARDQSDDERNLPSATLSFSTKRKMIPPPLDLSGTGTCDFPSNQQMLRPEPQMASTSNHTDVELSDSDVERISTQGYRRAMTGTSEFHSPSPFVVGNLVLSPDHEMDDKWSLDGARSMKGE